MMFNQGLGEEVNGKWAVLTKGHKVLVDRKHAIMTTVIMFCVFHNGKF